MRRMRGFTLIELLVVIAIIGILATLVVTQLSGAQTKARNTSARSDVTEMSKSVELFKADDNNGGNTPAAVYASPADAVQHDATLTAYSCLGSETWTTLTNNVICALFMGTMNANNANPLTYGTKIVKTPTGTASTNNYTYTYRVKGGAANQKVMASTTDYVVGTNLINDTSGAGFFYVASGASNTGNALPAIP